VIWRRSGDFWTRNSRVLRDIRGTFSRTTPVLDSGQTVFINARHADRKQQSLAGLLRDSPALSCARRLQRPSDPQVFDQFVANRIKLLPFGLVGEICGLCSRVALTRRMSAVRSRQHPPNSIAVVSTYWREGHDGTIVFKTHAVGALILRVLDAARTLSPGCHPGINFPPLKPGHWSRSVCSPQCLLARGRSAGFSPARRCTFRHLAATAVCPKVEKSDTLSRQTALINTGSRGPGPRRSSMLASVQVCWTGSCDFLFVCS
jgi:hypothetical protein